jgi:hypothetical protein
MKPDSSGPATAMAAPRAMALAISTALWCAARRASRARAISAMHNTMVRSSPQRSARRGASGASRPMHSTGSAVVRLMKLRLSDSSAAIRSISGAREVMPGRRLIAASTRATSSRARGTGFTDYPRSERQAGRIGHPTPAGPLGQACSGN